MPALLKPALLNETKKAGSVIFHCGAVETEEVEVRRIETPKPNGAHFPIPHMELYDTVVRALDDSPFRLEDPTFGIGHYGARFFALVNLFHESDSDYCMALGIRNSHDKAFSAHLCIGSRVFVCDNLAFSGEIKIARKHTTRIMRDLPRLVNTAVGKLNTARSTQGERIDAYRNKRLSEPNFHDFAIKCVDAKIIPPSRITRLLKEWREPQHKEFSDRTVWSAFNAATETLKKTNAFVLPRRTEALHGVADIFSGILN